jgi:hypothetical protein
MMYIVWKSITWEEVRMKEYKTVFNDHWLHVEHCPVCGEDHDFELEVDLRAVVSFLSQGGEMDAARTRMDGVVLTCPRTNMEFEENLLVYHRSYERCDSVVQKYAK